MTTLDREHDRQVQALAAVLSEALLPSAGLLLCAEEMRRIDARLRARVLIAAQLIEWQPR